MKHLIFLVCFLVITPVAAETVPIPPKRPKVMNVSPAFIEQLKNRNTQKDTEPQEDKPDLRENEALTPLPPPADKKKGKSGTTGLANLNPQDLLDILGEVEVEEKTPQKTKKEKNARVSSQPKKTKAIPVPTHKPLFEDLANIEPAAGDDEGTTLISFALKPEQIKLDPTLEMFLQDHALKLFRENKNMRMEIQAYATPIEGEQHSDVRISLARALEVRSFLIKNNIAASRLKLSPMGRDEDNDTDNRIDLLFVEGS